MYPWLPRREARRRACCSFSTINFTRRPIAADLLCCARNMAVKDGTYLSDEKSVGFTHATTCMELRSSERSATTPTTTTVVLRPSGYDEYSKLLLYQYSGLVEMLESLVNTLHRNGLLATSEKHTNYTPLPNVFTMGPISPCAPAPNLQLLTCTKLWERHCPCGSEI